MLNPVGNVNLVFEVPKDQYRRFCEVTLRGACHPESQSYNAGKIDFIEEATLFSSSMIVCKVWYRVSSCAGDPKHWSEFYRSLGAKWYDRPMETTSNPTYVPFFGAMVYPEYAMPKAQERSKLVDLKVNGEFSSWRISPCNAEWVDADTVKDRKASNKCAGAFIGTADKPAMTEISDEYTMRINEVCTNKERL